MLVFFVYTNLPTTSYYYFCRKSNLCVCFRLDYATNATNNVLSYLQEMNVLRDIIVLKAQVIRYSVHSVTSLTQLDKLSVQYVLKDGKLFPSRTLYQI